MIHNVDENDDGTAMSIHGVVVMTMKIAMTTNTMAITTRRTNHHNSDIPSRGRFIRSIIRVGGGGRSRSGGGPVELFRYRVVVVVFVS